MMQRLSLISIEILRNNPELVHKAMASRGENVPLERIMELDSERRVLISDADALRARRNDVSREIGRTKERPENLILEMRDVGSKIKSLEERIKNSELAINDLFPNLPYDLSLIHI